MTLVSFFKNMMNLEDYKVGDPLPVSSEDPLFVSENIDDTSQDDNPVVTSDVANPVDTPSVVRLRALRERFRDCPHCLSEYPSSESEVDMTTRTSIRDILFSYTGDVDVSKYRIPAPPQASLELTREGINYDKGDVDPEFALFSICESPNDKENLMDSRDVINQEEFHQNVFRRQEELRSRQAQRSNNPQPASATVSSAQSGPDSTSGQAGSR